MLANLQIRHTVKALYFPGIMFWDFPMNVSSLEFNFADFELLHFLQCTAKMFAWYLISQKQLIREINPHTNFKAFTVKNCTSVSEITITSIFIYMKQDEYDLRIQLMTRFSEP